MEWRFGATLGKMACKIKVVNLDMEFISIDQAFGRYLPWAISVIISLISSTSIFMSANFENVDTYMELATLSQTNPLNTTSIIYNFIFIVIVGSLAFDKRNQGFHDKISKTIVIKLSN